MSTYKVLNSFILHLVLKACCVPGNVLGTKNTVLKTDIDPVSVVLYASG